MKFILNASLTVLVLLVVSCSGGKVSAVSAPSDQRAIIPKQKIFPVVRDGIEYRVGIISSNEFSEENRTLGNVYKEALKRGWKLLPMKIGSLIWRGNEFSDENLKNIGFSYLAVMDYFSPDGKFFSFSIHMVGIKGYHRRPDGTVADVETDPEGLQSADGKCLEDEGFAFLVPIKLI